MQPSVGDPVLAADWVPYTPVVALKSSTTSRSSTTTVAADPDLAVELTEGTWEVFATLTVTGDGGDIKINWALTDCTNDGRHCEGPAVASTDPTDTNVRRTTHGSGTEVAYGTHASTGAYIHEVLGIVVAEGDSGQVVLQWAQNSSSGNATNVTGTSRLVARRVV